MNGPGGLPDKKDRTRLQGRALHALKFFTFHPSTPSPVLSNLMETAFFACATTHPFSVFSSDGVRILSEARIPNTEFTGFLKGLPLFPDDIVYGAKAMFAALRSREMTKDVTFVDVLDELHLRVLSETETVEYLKWWIGVTRRRNVSERLQRLEERTQLLDALVVSVSGPPKKTVRLSNTQRFLNSKTEAIIPTNGPLPSTVVPTSITSPFDPDDFASVFPWKQLSIIEWLRHVTDLKVAAADAEFDITRSAGWAERVLSVLAKAWPSLPETAQNDVIKVLNPKSCIPTSTGLKVPNQAHFPCVNLFRDLPIVTMPSGAIVAGDLEKVLQSLGVRKHVQLEIISDRSARLVLPSSSSR